MIPYAHTHLNQYNSTPLRVILCSVVFLDLTVFFFIVFMNICFDTLVSDPPPWLLLLLFGVMGLDLFAELYWRKWITVAFVGNTIIMVFLVLSWTLDNQYTLFLSALVLLRFP